MVSSPLFLSLKNREASSRKGESIKLEETETPVLSAISFFTVYPFQRGRTI